MAPGTVTGQCSRRSRPGGRKQEKISVNPVREFHRRKEPDGVICWLDLEQEIRQRKGLVDEVESTPADQPTLRKQRLHRIYELDIALGTGIRRAEQYRITWPTVNLNRKEIIIAKTKFGPARTVHIILAVERALKANQSGQSSACQSAPSRLAKCLLRQHT